MSNKTLVIQKQIEDQNFYTAQEKNAWFVRYENTYSFIDEGADIFHSVEHNYDGIGDRIGDTVYSNKFVFAAPVNGEYYTEDEIERISKLKVFL